jgi:hypothetical protein
VLLQYQRCKTPNADGSVNIPISVEALYGYIFSKVHAKATIAARSYVDVATEPFIGALRSSALSTVVETTYYNSTVLTQTTMNTLQASASELATMRESVPEDASELSPVERSEQVPLNDADCGISAPAGTWKYRVFPTQGVTDMRVCCAMACTAILQTIGITPTGLTMDSCCIGCNKYNCDPANTTISSAVALLTVVPVPSLLNPFLVTVNITL